MKISYSLHAAEQKKTKHNLDIASLYEPERPV